MWLPVAPHSDNDPCHGDIPVVDGCAEASWLRRRGVWTNTPQTRGGLSLARPLRTACRCEVRQQTPHTDARANRKDVTRMLTTDAHDAAALQCKGSLTISHARSTQGSCSAG